ncbi:unnamed protein product [Cylindrotheca closterium]|uniref:Uncharacterized protein n=1 Tax=Cylindrotheca closterium TaxID=2856 RepID=A0AAD2FXV5_9STRA|nr:unnamed protein product [Cylindrotheca closterium]
MVNLDNGETPPKSESADLSKETPPRSRYLDDCQQGGIEKDMEPTPGSLDSTTKSSDHEYMEELAKTQGTFVEKVPLSKRLYCRSEVHFRLASESFTELCGALWASGCAAVDNILYNMRKKYTQHDNHETSQQKGATVFVNKI